MVRVNYGEGDWFAVPFHQGGYAVGVVARANPEAALLGYFFGPKRADLPTLDQVRGLAPAEAILVCRFGHLGLVKGKWPVLGRSEDWDRSRWPMPVFVRYEELSGRSFRVFYADDDPSKLLREEQVPAGEPEQGPKDGLAGAGFVEHVLAGLLR
jgi:hypothetical protein